MPVVFGAVALLSSDGASHFGSTAGESSDLESASVRHTDAREPQHSATRKLPHSFGGQGKACSEPLGSNGPDVSHCGPIPVDAEPFQADRRGTRR